MFGSIEAVVAAIQEDAQAEAERVEAQASQAIDRLRREDTAEPVTLADADRRIAMARRRIQEQKVADDWADHEASLRDREAWIQAVAVAVDAALRMLPAAALRADAARLAREALERMPAAPLSILVPLALSADIEAIRSDPLLRGDSRITEIVADSQVAGGCIVRSIDRHVQYDNTYLTRLRRLEPRWRSRLAAIHESPALV